MNILFVWPSRGLTGFRPIGSSILISLLRDQGHNVKLFHTLDYTEDNYNLNADGNRIRLFKPVDLSIYGVKKVHADVEDIFKKTLKDFKPDIVMFSVLINVLDTTLRLTKLTKEYNKNIITVWGNAAFTFQYTDLIKNKFIDYGCVGEGIQFINDFNEFLNGRLPLTAVHNIVYLGNNGEIIANKLAAPFEPLDKLPYIDWSDFEDRHFYRPFDGVAYRAAEYMITWGCKHACTYCSNTEYMRIYSKNNHKKFIRQYSIDRAIKELVYLKERYNITLFHFQDEDFFLMSEELLEDFADKYLNLVALPFIVMGNARHVTDKKVELLKQAGCIGITVGVESGDEFIREKVLNGRETPDEITHAVQKFNSAGIRTSSLNMIGLPFENRERIMNTIKINRESGFKSVSVGFFSPLPSTKLRQVSIDNGFFDEHKNTDYGYDKVSLTLPDISAEELVKIRDRFHLYVMMPDELIKYIERSEADDYKAIKLTEYLYELDDKYIIQNNGRWISDKPIADIIKEIENIIA